MSHNLGATKLDGISSILFVIAMHVDNECRTRTSRRRTSRSCIHGIDLSVAWENKLFSKFKALLSNSLWTVFCNCVTLSQKLHRDGDKTFRDSSRLSFVITELLSNSLFCPGRDLCQVRASIEEVEDDDRHDYGDCGHRHHERQIDTWNWEYTLFCWRTVT